MSFQRKQPRVHDKRHLIFIRALPCIACMREGSFVKGVDAAHVRHAFPGWQPVGGGEKPDDHRAVPLCREHHTEQHDVSVERVWWARLGVDPVSLCADLVAAFPNGFNGDQVIIDHAKRAARQRRLENRLAGLTRPLDAAPPAVTISAHLSDQAPDADGNVAVLLSLTAGQTVVARVAPDTITRGDR